MVALAAARALPLPLPLPPTKVSAPPTPSRQPRHRPTGPLFRLPASRAEPKRPLRVLAGLDVFALDFDGVVVDSEPEVSEYGLVAAQRRWPEALSGVQEPGARAALLAALRDCRPRLVKGYEAMVMARLLAEDGARVAAVLRDWPALLAASLESWGCDAEELSAEFQALRAEAMAAHKKEWLRGSKPYKGMVDALRHCPSPVYFASSKAGGLVSLLLRENLGLDIPEESPRLYGGLLPPNEAKVAALRDIASRPVCQTLGAKLHFIDDRFETLQAMTAPGEHAVEGWNLYLAGWGYNTEDERAEARAAGIRVLSLEECCELLKWGVLMGVDDGCEPEAHEITH